MSITQTNLFLHSTSLPSLAPGNNVCTRTRLTRDKGQTTQDHADHTARTQQPVHQQHGHDRVLTRCDSLVWVIKLSDKSCSNTGDEMTVAVLFQAQFIYMYIHIHTHIPGTTQSARHRDNQYTHVSLVDGTDDRAGMGMFWLQWRYFLNSVTQQKIIISRHNNNSTACALRIHFIKLE